MLEGISPLLSSDLLKTLHEMGRGDELGLADAHFAGHSLGRRVLRADGLSVTSLLALHRHEPEAPAPVRLPGSSSTPVRVPLFASS